MYNPFASCMHTGNLMIFTEVGRAFWEFGIKFCDARRPLRDKEFQQWLSSSFSYEQQMLGRAFEQYYLAMWESNRTKQHEYVRHGNTLTWLYKRRLGFVAMHGLARPRRFKDLKFEGPWVPSKTYIFCKCQIVFRRPKYKDKKWQDV